MFCPKGFVEMQIGPIIDADEIQKQQRTPYTFRGMTIREVPIDEPVQKKFDFRRAKEGLKIWGNTHRSE
jgi:hypothetical protein